MPADATASAATPIVAATPVRRDEPAPTVFARNPENAEEDDAPP